MLAGKPGVYEYEIEAAAVFVILKHGARRPVCAPIVGSGPNPCVWHYDKNSRRVEDGDLAGLGPLHGRTKRGLPDGA